MQQNDSNTGPVRTVVSGLLVGALILSVAGLAAHADSNALRTAVTLAGVRGHQAAFQGHADANGGTRVAGSPGHADSVTYVVNLLNGAGYNVTLQPVNYPYFEELSPPILNQIAPAPTVYPPNDPSGFATMAYSGSGDVTALTQGVDLVLPPGPVVNTSDSGCEAADFVGFVAGRIAILQRGSCTFQVKAQNAQNAGAVGVVIFNEGQAGRTDTILGTLSAPGIAIPVVGSAFAVGQTLAGPGVTARIRVDAISELRASQNIIAETPGGASDSVVMAGAHLDSVPAGPGIQDNGSGSAALLEIALQLDALGITPVNKIRFAWWGAEEQGLVGSTTYLTGLTPGELDDIALYLNAELIGSPNFVRFVYDGDGSTSGFPGPPGSGAIEQIFLDYFVSQTLPTEPISVISTHHFPLFGALDIPSGGLFGGAEGIKTAAQTAIFGGTTGDQYDPCYHLACDTFDNVSLMALDQFSDALAHAILTLAQGPDLSFGCEQDPPEPVEEICSNGIDDDCDGLIDLDDEEECRPLLVYLDSFTAKAGPRGVRLQWRTSAEIDNLGFRILRSRPAGDTHQAVEPVAITPLISSRGSTFNGAQYEYVDTERLEPGVVQYWLEDVDMTGRVTRHGPLTIEVRRKVPRLERGQRRLDTRSP